MNLLKDLWDGKIRPSERAVRAGSEYEALQKGMIDDLERLNERLDPEEKNLLKEYCEKVLQAEDISNEEAFISGVQIGAKFILDVIGEYPLQLPQMGESE